MLLRFIFFTVVGWVVWRWLDGQFNRPPPQQPPPAPPGGFVADTEQLVRCDRCGVRVPASQVAAIRANCKICGGA